MTQEWKLVRIGLLATTFAGVLLVLVKSIFYPASSDRTRYPFEFPPEVALPGWQSLESKSLVPTEDSVFLSARNYQYVQNNRSLEIKMYYVIVDDASGIQEVLEQHGYGSWVISKAQMQENKQIGFYAFWQSEQQVNLGACINPYGDSTVTTDQFGQNHNVSALKLRRIVPWLLGTDSLRDLRCLWTTLSMPLETGESVEKVYPILEEAWFSWYDSWQPRFPEP